MIIQNALQVHASVGQPADVYLLDSIGWTGMDAQQLQRDLAKALEGASEIRMHINSPGGDVFQGWTMYNMLKAAPVPVYTYVYGLAASMGSIVMLAGRKIYLAEQSKVMIHNPYGWASGSAGDMERMKVLLEKITSDLVAAYRARTGKDEADIRAKMDVETWFTAQEAIEYGLADELFNAPVAQAMFSAAAAPAPPTDKPDQHMKELLKALGLAESATEAEAIAALNQLKAQIEAVKSESLAEGALLAATQLGAIPKDNEAAFQALIKANPKAALSVLPKAEAHVPAASLTNHLIDPGQANAQTERQGWSWSDWSKKDPQGLENMYTNDFEAFNRLYKAEFNTNWVRKAA